MNEYLIKRKNSYISGQITELNPSLLTTYGALTIVDNTNENNYINGLVPNSYSLLLDQLFLASGYGFSSYSDYDTATYIINTYNDVYNDLVNSIEELKNKKFEFNFNPNNPNELNKFAQQYNSYGCLTSYIYFDVTYNGLSYQLNSKKFNTQYFEDIQLKYSINGGTDLTINPNEQYCIEFGNSITLTYSFNYGGDIKKVKYIKDTKPNIYINDNIVKLPSDNEDAKGIIEIPSNNFPIDLNNNFTLDIKTKRNNSLIYHKEFKNLFKWRHKIVCFNAILNEEEINILYSNTLNNDVNEKIEAYDAFNQILFNSLSENSNNIDQEIFNSFNTIYNSCLNKFIFLDDSLEVPFIGDCYYKNNNIIYSHDYVILKISNQEDVNLRFFMNGFESKNWGKIISQNENDKYIIYQSPQKYIGKHTWTIKYE